MVHFKKLSEISMEEAVYIWNRGFEGYMSNIQMTIPNFITRLVNEGLSLEDSFAAYIDGQPLGIVLNGFRDIDGKKVAWNGGTGVVPEYRGQGWGKKLMERKLELYAEQGVNLALLEALSENEKAIRLYQSVGFEIVDRLAILQNLEPLESDLLRISSPERYTIRKGLPRDVRPLSFYQKLGAWQTQWPSLKDGESLLVCCENEIVGYALFKKVFDAQGNLSAISLYQCEAGPSRSDAEDILKTALQGVYQPLEMPYRRMTMNLSSANTRVTELLHKLGFILHMEQVQMTRQITG